MDIRGAGPLKQVTWEAVVIRADGTVEDLGVISYWHKNPLRRLQHALSTRFSRS